MTAAVLTQDLKRTFTNKKPGGKTTVTALDGVDLEIRPGELFGLLGPNGAGKTTVIKILSTLLLPSSGQAWVAGFDAAKSPHQIRQLINMVTGGDITGYGLLTARENVWMFSQLYGIPNKKALAKIDNLFAILGLTEKAGEKVHSLSTGMKQKLNLIRGFINDPQILFLDEPTLGLDVNISREVRSFVKDWMKEDEKRTILLTTHYMLEAEELCDRIAIIDQGKVLALDTPDNLKKILGDHCLLELEVRLRPESPPDFKSLVQLKRCDSDFNPATGTFRFKFVLEETEGIHKILSHLISQGGEVIRLNQPQGNLEDVFVRLTGKTLEENV